jgi:PHD/YefM family antitoxin component YafN of YafNO toxin-antitoxin module
MQTKIPEVESLSDFTSNPVPFLAKLRESGEPVLLTVEGKGEVVVQDAASYQRFLELLDRAQSIAAIKEGLEDLAAGRHQPMREFLDELAKQDDFIAPNDD